MCEFDRCIKMERKEARLCHRCGDIGFSLHCTYCDQKAKLVTVQRPVLTGWEVVPENSEEGAAT